MLSITGVSSPVRLSRKIHYIALGNPMISPQQIETLKGKISYLQQAMLDVATYSKDINEIEDTYKKVYGDMELEIDIIQEIEDSLTNPNPFPSLWDWYNFYSSKTQLTLAQRCSHIFDIYSGLLSTLQEIQCHIYLSSLSGSERVELIGPEKIGIIKNKIEAIKGLMKDISTSRGADIRQIIGDNEENYREMYSDVDFEMLTISKLDFHLSNKNNFWSLWQWYRYWQSELRSYSSRQQYVDELYEDSIKKIKRFIRKSELEADTPKESLRRDEHHSQINRESFPKIALNSQAYSGNKTGQSSSKSQAALGMTEVAHPIFTSDEKFKVDFAIITALEIERKKVCEVLGLSDSQRVKKGSRVYWRGRLNIRDESYYDLVVAQCTDMGNVSSSGLAFDIIHYWEPNAILMVGVAGAAQEEQNLGDIALGRAVYCYEFGKVINGTYEIESREYQADSMLWNHVLTLPDWNEPISIQRPDGLRGRPTIHRGVIASGEKRISDAHLRDVISSKHNNVVAIEMEGYGVKEAVWQAANTKKCLIIRAICDLANSSENNDWHPYASEVAASYTKHFLLDCPLEPKKQNVSYGMICSQIRSTEDYEKGKLEDSDFFSDPFEPD